MPYEATTHYKLVTALRPLASFAWRLLLTLTICRAALVLWQWERVSDADMLANVFIEGLRFDLVLLGMLLAIPVLAFPFLASTRFTVPGWRWLLKISLPVALLAVLFMECSTPSFVEQFDGRPNMLFLEYLNHPKEIGSTLWVAYRIPIILALLLVSIYTWINARQISRLVARIEPTGILPAVLATPVLLLLCFAMIRSTFDHRPVNPSTVALSKDPLVNELALSSLYNVGYAVYETRYEEDGGFRYAPIDDAEAIALVRDAMHIDEAAFSSSELPTLHLQTSAVPAAERKNLVIIIEESLGAEFVGSLGGLDLTPNIDALAKEGIWFSNLYATGTRSVRGLEAIVSGFTPTPAKSVVKLPKSQRGFFTLAELLANAGYDTSFIYGGEAQFDNMRRFFMNNGFDTVIDKNDYDDPVFTGSWGVSDEDLFNRAHETFSNAGSKPFFSLIFSSSNHSPFEFPDGRIDLYDADKATVNNAVKYADHTLGEFIARAKKGSYWKDTVFLIVADHNSRVYGSELVPVTRFHIPAVIVGGSIEPQVFAPVASQIDLGPTLLSLIGVGAEHPMIGRDLTTAAARLQPGRAIMQFNATQAYMQGDRVAVMQKDLPMLQFNFVDGRLEPCESFDPVLARLALAHSAWSSMAYDQSLYRLPGDGD